MRVVFRFGAAVEFSVRDVSCVSRSLGEKADRLLCGQLKPPSCPEHWDKIEECVIGGMKRRTRQI